MSGLSRVVAWWCGWRRRSPGERVWRAVNWYLIGLLWTPGLLCDGDVWLGVSARALGLCARSSRLPGWLWRECDRCSALSAQCSVLGARCSVLGARCSVLGARCWALGAGCLGGWATRGGCETRGRSASGDCVGARGRVGACESSAMRDSSLTRFGSSPRARPVFAAACARSAMSASVAPQTSCAIVAGLPQEGWPSG